MARFLVLALFVAVSLAQFDDDDIDMEALLQTVKESRSELKIPPPPAPVKKAAGKGKFRKGSVDEESVAAARALQKIQADRLAVAAKSGKKQIELASSEERVDFRKWDVSCHSGIYENAYGFIKGCTPRGTCQRVVRDNFATDDDCDRLYNATQIAMRNLFHQAGATSLAPQGSASRLGFEPHLLYEIFVRRARLQVMRDYNCEKLYDSGALLTRLKADPPRDEWELDPNHNAYNSHVDKANIPTYDFSALLYLNSKGSDYDGGDFIFQDDDADRVVAPVKGRLLTFTSGAENLHQVLPVTRGDRLVLAMWFTCSKDHKFNDDSDD